MAIIYNTATTLNGFIADEDNSLQWLFDVAGNEDAESDFGDFLSTIAAIVMGSTTYEWLLREMDLLNSPEQWTQAYGDRPTWVFSSRSLAVPEGANIRVINSPVESALPMIRSSAQGDGGTGHIWIVGGGDLAGQFLDVGALDRIVLTMAPVFLPAGAPTFPRRLESARLELAGMRELGRFVEFTFDVTGTPQR